MALYKEIRQENGVTTSYHRILFIQSMINRRTSIAVVSYVDEQSRDDEKTKIFTEPYQQSITYEKDYDENITIEKAYEFIKSLPEFEGAVDI